MSNKVREGNMPHIFWIDLRGDDVYTECAVMKRDELGNVYFFPLTALDNIDKRRLARIVSNRNAGHFELWDLMSNITLNNGVNALTYFHQLVQVLTSGGRIMKPQEGVIGFRGQTGVIDMRSKDDRTEMERTVNAAARAAAGAAADAAASAVRNASRQQFAPAPAQLTESVAPVAVKKKRPIPKKKVVNIPVDPTE